MSKKPTEVTEYSFGGRTYKGGLNNRLNFSKISGSTELPNLVEIQTESFKWFLKEGLDEVLKECFPISNYAGTVFIDYVSSRFEPAQFEPLECKESDLTYSSKLKVTLRLRDASGQIREDNEVFMGEIPMMTDSGTFIFNGAERVIVSQIVRSPGAYFTDDVQKSGAHLYTGEITPSRGTWLQFESDTKKFMWVRIDRQKKMPATILYKALGFDSEDTLKELFGESELMLNTLGKDKKNETSKQALEDIFKKLKSGEPVTDQGIVNFLVQKFFDDKRNDLGPAGRFKYSAKLGIYDRLVGRVLAEDLVASEEDGGAVVFEKKHKLTKRDVANLRDMEFFEHGAHKVHLNANPALDQYSDVNIVRVYANDDPEDIIVKIIGTDLALNGDENTPSVSRITISDMVATFSYLMGLQYGIGRVDDIDHLGNRRIRCVGELLQIHFRMGLNKMAKTVQQKMSITDLESAKPSQLINIRPLTSAVREFFASNHLSQFMDQTNPLAELTNKRRISALGLGGITRDRASM
ncbi:MAG: DNA-directed RNA polymerase subunit beta, partial [Bacilli bacterium]|nr:DNA-directed RNA polymerase subunit beta [Bacilli bacterium]